MNTFVIIAISLIVLLLWVILDHLLSHIKEEKERHNEIVIRLSTAKFELDKINQKTERLEHLVHRIR